jgi:protein tyrosine/serine phosphatase
MFVSGGIPQRMHQSIGTPGPWKTRHLYASLRILLPALLSAAIWAGAQTTSPARVDISNFGQINQGYYRGGQPDGAGFAELKQLGIRTVIDLQEDGDAREPVWVRGEGMQYFNVPLSSRRPSTDAQTEYFLRLVNDAKNLPVYVHCAGGRHRTGEMTAIYRITHDTWTADQAYREMKEYDFYSIGGHGPLKQYVYQYYSEHISPKPKTAASLETPALIRN